jgi:2-methylaconitate cis-trans-isomerase PrpF
MDWALERVLRAWKSNCGAFSAAVGTQAAVSGLES